MAISVQNLNHIYSKNGPFERAAVKDISFEILDGEFIGIIGHTGSGKSTLIQHLNGLLRPDSGHIYVDGMDICKKVKPELKVIDDSGYCVACHLPLA